MESLSFLLVLPSESYRSPSYLMKIKYKPLKGVKKTKAYHAWLSPELPKKGGRLSQLNKSNRRKPSEFVLMAQQIEENGTRRR